MISGHLDNYRAPSLSDRSSSQQDHQSWSRCSGHKFAMGGDISRIEQEFAVGQLRSSKDEFEDTTKRQMERTPLHSTRELQSIFRCLAVHAHAQRRTIIALKKRWSIFLPTDQNSWGFFFWNACSREEDRQEILHYHIPSQWRRMEAHYSTAFHNLLLIFDRLNRRRMRQENACVSSIVSSRERNDQKKNSRQTKLVKSWRSFFAFTHLGLW